MSDYVITNTLPVAQVPPTVHMFVQLTPPDLIACNAIVFTLSHLHVFVGQLDMHV